MKDLNPNSSSSSPIVEAAPLQPPSEPLPVATILPPNFTHQKSYSSILNHNPKSNSPLALSKDDVARLCRSYSNPIVTPRAIVDEGCQSWKLPCREVSGLFDLVGQGPLRFVGAVESAVGLGDLPHGV